MATEDTSLDNLLSETEAAPAQTIEPAAVEAEPKGDKEHAPAPPADAQAPTDDGPLVPRKALEDERRKRQDYERRFAELERQIQASRQPPKQETPRAVPIDPWVDPEGAFNQMRQEQHYAIFETRLSLGEEIMSAKPDYEAAKAAFVEAATADPSLAQKMVTHANPAKFVYEQGRKISAMREIGDDPASYRARIEAEVMEKFNGQQPAPVQKPQAVPAPKSLAGQPSTASRDSQGRFAPSSGPASLEDILG